MIFGPNTQPSSPQSPCRAKCDFPPRAALILISALAILAFVPQQLWALDTSFIPFVGSATDADIELNNNKELKKLLVAELNYQRKENRQLKLYQSSRKIADYERQLLDKRLRAEGYYGATLSSKISDSGAISHTIDPGSLYTIETLDFQLGTVTINQEELPIALHQPLKALAILDARNQLRNLVAKESCLYRVDVQYDATVFHKSHSAKVVFKLKPSLETQFSAVQIVGTETVDPEYLYERISLRPGQCYRRSDIDDARLNLLQTNLLKSASVRETQPDDNGVAVFFEVAERDHKTVSLGAGFRSEEGFGVTTGWQHRNLLGRAQTLDTELYIAQIRQTLSGKLTIPNFLTDKQLLTFYGDLEQEDTDAYQSEEATMGVNITKPLRKRLRGDIGVQADLSSVEEDGDTEEYALISLPMKLDYDHRNSELDPRKGWVTGMTIQPYWDLNNTSTQFLKSSIAISAYLTGSKLPWQPTLAVRAATGSITGANRDDVPANERFYVGGGGSVRGYKYQTLGPLTDGDPDGGLSFTEYSIETRLHWGESWGGVAFIDGGLAYAEEVPSINETLLWGAGVGIRYYTSFAPIRFDVAWPLDRRDDIDASFQIYISIGQAF